MNNELTVLLGAGFSANAGMPMGKEIAKMFNRDLREKLLLFSSSEWAWEDNKSDAARRNGKLNYDCLAYSYIFDQIVKSYVDQRNGFKNYEDFYQFLIDKSTNKQWLEKIFSIARKSLIRDKPFLLENEYYDNYLYPIDKKQYGKVSDILNYLIGDLLRTIPKTSEELKKIYSPFISYIKKFEVVNIFTLNHDILLETLLEMNNLAYSTGHSVMGSCVEYNGEKIPCFDNDFNENINIHKLHGSIDFYKFRYYQKNGNNIFLSPTEKYVHFTTRDYHVKHGVKMIDTNTNEVIQDMNFDIVPKFITGTDKKSVIENDFLFKSLFNNFENIISQTKHLLVSGYSFRDNHVNEIIKSGNFKCVNQNPYQKYSLGGNGINIAHLSELNHL